MKNLNEKVEKIPLKDVKHCSKCGHQTDSKGWCPNCQKHVKTVPTYKLKHEGVKMKKLDRIMDKYLSEGALLGEEVPPINTEIPVIQKRETNIAVDRSGDTVQKTPVSAPTQTHQGVTNAAQDYLSQIHNIVNGDSDPVKIVAAIKQHLVKFNKEHTNKNAPMPTFKKA